MPIQNANAFFGAAVIGVITAASLYLVEHYRQERRRHAMARDLARLDNELSTVKRDLQELLAKKREKPVKSRKRPSNKANSVISSSTNDDYLSASNLDSSDLEFYDVSEDELDNSTTNIDAVLSEIDKKLDEGKDLEQCLEKLQDLCMEHPQNSDLLWRIGKTHNKMAERSDNKQFIQDQIKKGIEACTKALEIQPNSADTHKWIAILIGSRGDYQPMNEKISDGYLFKSHVDKALEINPSDPSLHHMLGRFDYEVAGLKWYERKVAAAFFAEPPNSTYAEALEHFIECEKLANFEWKENKLMIAKCKIATKEYKEAIEWLLKAYNCKQGDGLDDKIDSEIKALLEQYNSYR